MSEPDNQPDQIDIMDEQELRTEFRALVSRLGMANMEADKQRAENKELSSRLAGYRWIPVAERLPVELTWTLAALPSGDVLRAYYRQAGFRISAGSSSDLRPTHWMPLPEPPT